MNSIRFVRGMPYNMFYDRVISVRGRHGYMPAETEFEFSLS